MIPLCVPQMGSREWTYVKECLDTNFVSSVGPFVSKFEEVFAAKVGAPQAVACASGTAALHVALRLTGVERGDEVFVSDFTFVATINPILYQGAVPVLVDAERVTWNMDPALVAAELDSRAARGLRQPKAVLVAHLLGMPADLAPIYDACVKHGVTLIEDAAEALGASYVDGPFAGRQVGTLGTLGCFSFNGNKIITSGGGGMVVTADEGMARRARHLTTQARLPGTEYLHDEMGYNYRLTNPAAALGLAQLEQLDAFIARKLAIAARYDAVLSGLPGVTVPPRPSWAAPTMWLYSILLNPAVCGVDRKVMLERLESKGVQTRPVWAPAHVMAMYAEYPRLGGSVGEALFAEGLSLPCSVGLTDDDQARVIDACLEVLG